VISGAKPDSRISCTEHSNTFPEAVAGDQGDLEPSQWEVGGQKQRRQSEGTLEMKKSGGAPHVPRR